MAEKGRITVNEVDIIEVSSDPSVTGIKATIGSLAIENADDLWQKWGSGDSDWAPISRDLKSGSVSAGSFTPQGTPPNRKATVTFSKAVPDTNYSVSIQGVSDLRSFSIENKTVNGFTINTNANSALTDAVLWSIIQHGETA